MKSETYLRIVAAAGGLSIAAILAPSVMAMAEETDPVVDQLPSEEPAAAELTSPDAVTIPDPAAELEPAQEQPAAEPEETQPVAQTTEEPAAAEAETKTDPAETGSKTEAAEVTDEAEVTDQEESPAPAEAAQPKEKEQNAQPAVQNDEEPAEEEAAPAASVEAQAENVAFIGDQGYSSVQAALDAIGENGTATIDLKANSSDIALIRKGQTVTLNIAEGVVWDNLNAPKPQINGWENTVLANQGTLYLNNQGTIVPDSSKSQSFCFVNDYGATAVINGGTYTSMHGDYLMRNYGIMTIDGNAYFLKQFAGSPSIITNGWKDGTPAGAAPAKLIVNSCKIESTVSSSIGVKNDDNGILEFNGGSVDTTIDIQNWNVAIINGGSFTSKGNNPNIHNGYSNDTDIKGQLIIHGGDFYAGNDSAPVFRHVGNGGSITIDGGTYYADQSIIRDNLVAPYVLREIPDSDPVRYQVAIPVTSVTIDPEKSEVYETETVTLTATVDPENATFRTVTWKNLTPDIVSMVVDDSDPDQPKVILTALKEGVAQIEATADGQSATAEVTVKKASLAVDPAEKTIREGETFLIRPETVPESLASSIIWTSSDPAVATVDANGTVTGLKEGTVAITASIGTDDPARTSGLSASCIVTVLPAEKPDTPETPETPDKPETPETPDKPETPETPETPDTPQKPETPVKPEMPAEPVKPEQPSAPDQTETVQKPIHSGSGNTSSVAKPVSGTNTGSSKVNTAAFTDAGFWTALAGTAGLGSFFANRRASKKNRKHGK